MSEPFTVHSPVPSVFCADAGAISDWCQQVLGFTERGFAVHERETLR